MKEFIREEISGLARIVARGFDATDRKIESVYRELKFDVAELKSDMVAVNGRLDSVYQELKSDIVEVKMTVNRIEIQTRNHGDAIYEEMADVRKETRKEIEVVKEDIIAVKAFVGMKA